MKAYRPLRAGLVALLATATLSACADARRALGYDKSPPDEFAVVARAPLSQPPDFNLRPPAPGAPRPQEGTSSDQARAALTPGKSAPATPDTHSKGEQFLLAKSGADRTNADIRHKVDEETTALVEANESFTDRLIFWQTKMPPGEVVNSAAEAKRLQENAALGRPPTAGETVKIERRDRSFLDGIF